MDNGEKRSQDRKADTPENRREGQTLPLRQVPQAQPKAGQHAGPLVLPQLPNSKRRTRIGVRGNGHVLREVQRRWL
jgi:hypothetical protein